MTRPCTAIRRHGGKVVGKGDVALASIRRHGGKVVGKGDVALTSMNLMKHAEIAYPAPRSS